MNPKKEYKLLADSQSDDYQNRYKHGSFQGIEWVS